MEEFTSAELVALEKFRQKVDDALIDKFSQRNENLIRWLRARDLDLAKAEELFRTSMKWRQENKIERILEIRDAFMEANYPYYFDGFDNNGGLVVSSETGKWDIRKTVEEDGPDRFLRHVTQMLETFRRKIQEICEESEENNPRGMRYTYIVSMEGFSFRQLANMKCVNTMLQMVSIYEAQFPETLATAYVVDAPTVFTILFNLMKPLMTARTLNKVQIFGSKREQWQPVVLEAISQSQIRVPFGGIKI